MWEYVEVGPIAEDEEAFDSSYKLPPDITLVKCSNGDPKTFNEALCGPDAKHWQEALEYKINQLEKLGTWKVVDLPAGHTAIPCSEVVRVKRGLNGDIQSYRVRIVAGGHNQVEGVNYTETFLAAAKMSTIHTIPANAASQD